MKTSKADPPSVTLNFFLPQQVLPHQEVDECLINKPLLPHPMVEAAGEITILLPLKKHRTVDGIEKTFVAVIDHDVDGDDSLVGYYLDVYFGQLAVHLKKAGVVIPDQTRGLII